MKNIQIHLNGGIINPLLSLLDKYKEDVDVDIYTINDFIEFCDTKFKIKSFECITCSDDINSILYNKYKWSEIYIIAGIHPTCKSARMALAYTNQHIDFHLLSSNPPLFYWNLYNK